MSLAVLTVYSPADERPSGPLGCTLGVVGSESGCTLNNGRSVEWQFRITWRFSTNGPNTPHGSNVTVPISS